MCFPFAKRMLALGSELFTAAPVGQFASEMDLACWNYSFSGLLELNSRMSPSYWKLEAPRDSSNHPSHTLTTACNKASLAASLHVPCITIRRLTDANPTTRTHLQSCKRIGIMVEPITRLCGCSPCGQGKPRRRGGFCASCSCMHSGLACRHLLPQQYPATCQHFPTSKEKRNSTKRDRQQFGFFNPKPSIPEPTQTRNLMFLSDHPMLSLL